jgi:hypothetical protein
MNVDMYVSRYVQMCPLRLYLGRMDQLFRKSPNLRVCKNVNGVGGALRLNGLSAEKWKNKINEIKRSKASPRRARATFENFFLKRQQKPLL